MGAGDLVNEINEIVGQTQAVDVLAIKTSIYWTQSVVSFILGLVAYGIIVIVPMVTALDCVYIVYPGTRRTLQDGHFAFQRVRLVSFDAIAALKETELTNKNPLTVYLMKRIKMEIICAIVLFMMVSGGWNVIKDIVNQFVDSLLTAIMM